MLNSKLFLLFTLLGLMSLVSCIPQATTSSVGKNSSVTGGTSGGSTTLYSEPTYPIDNTFVQEGGVQTTTNFSLPVNFSDSFLIRGKNLSVFLRTLPNTTAFCLVGKYKYNPGQDKFLILAAKSKSYTDLVNKTTEFYLQVEPANDSSNQNDCLTYNLTNTLFTGASSPSAYFSITQLCTDCSTTVTSEGLKLYYSNGEQISTLNVSTFLMTISGSTSSSGNTCVDNSACQARGYDCCLNTQCVSDGAVKPNATLDSGFEAAQADVANNPTRFILYPQYYYVCGSSTGTTTGSTTGGSTTIDPNYELTKRMLELKHLYQCLNKVDGEFSYCTMKYTSVAQGSTYSANTDDITFRDLNSSLDSNNIVGVRYAGQTLYDVVSQTTLIGATWETAGNDNLTAAQSIKLTMAPPTNAQDNFLYVTYKVDGTCEQSGTTLAKCSKSYIYMSSTSNATTSHDASKTFLLPSYADLSSSMAVIVKIGGVTVAEDSSTWSRATSPNRIVFASSYPIYQNQTIDISYFVTSGVASLIKSKAAVQTDVNTMCACGSSGKCNLKPVYDTSNAITNYECVYVTESSTTPPANQTVYVSSKNVPHRYYDINGVNYDSDYSTAPTQEGVAFSYTNNDVLKPSNVSTYTGFNEIYGSFTKNDSAAAKPAKQVSVKKDTNYDIYVNSGTFSSCLNCGSDYYTSLQKIFPQNFAGKAGGYTPDKYESRRQANASIYRSDDLLYGRACFAPATMIPWSHVAQSTPTAQRNLRLASQHFLFANGYNRDWYGFDYGSLIGSFDGVSWFSIGNARKIKATTSKLFLAINAYYGDLSVDSNFSVTVSESSAYSSSIPVHDTETDGAECQKSHFCSTDNDCVRQLGYDYTCQNVTSLTTNWPVFDPAGSEVVGSVQKTLIALAGGSNGQAKRCVYRGRGAPCHVNLASTSSTFNSSSLTGTLACSPNNYCQPLTGSYSNRFNDRIARFATTPTAQNLASAASPLSDTVGLGARIIGRPFDFYGTKNPPTASLTGLNSNLVSAVCTPGKNISASTTTAQLNSNPVTGSQVDSSDKIFGVGSTLSSQNSKLLNACPATDAVGAYLHNYDVTLGDTTSLLHKFTTAQNMSSNLLDLAPLTTSTSKIFSSTSGSQITAVGYQRNTCLRAPGASCFSDMDCAPSSFVSAKVAANDLSSYLNAAEINFWKEELTCGNPDFKYGRSGGLNENFDVKKNFCCREMGKTMTVYTETNTSDYKWCETSGQISVAGVTKSLSSFNRYSRVHTGFDKMTCSVDAITDTTKFALSVKTPAASSGYTTFENRFRQIQAQYKTLDAINQRTCCTQNWVRSFHAQNGGGHTWGKGKTQNIDKKSWKNVNWLPDHSLVADATSFPDPDGKFDCDGILGTNYSNASCEVRNFTTADEKLYLEWAGSLELIGIPQVAIKTNDQIKKLVNDNQDAVATNTPLNNTIKDVNLVGADFVEYGTGNKYYSAAYDSNYSTKYVESVIKPKFSESEFNCCIPTNTELPSTTTASQCCTGYMANTGASTTLRCCLPDYTDVSLYLNRYVSSEGNSLVDSAYDPATGYIKDAGMVKTLEAQKRICCSGKAVYGYAISKLHKPVNGGYIDITTPGASTRRFVDGDESYNNNSQTGGIADLYDAGIRWNNHVYCVPADFQEPNSP